MEKGLYRKVNEMFKKEIRQEFDEAVNKLSSSVLSMEEVLASTQTLDKLDKIDKHLRHQKYIKIIFSTVMIILILLKSEDPLASTIEILSLISGVF
jgi:hypothetical protein